MLNKCNDIMLTISPLSLKYFFRENQSKSFKVNNLKLYEQELKLITSFYQLHTIFPTSKPPCQTLKYTKLGLYIYSNSTTIFTITAAAAALLIGALDVLNKLYFPSKFFQLEFFSVSNTKMSS